jgi:Glucodextranase, domain B
MSSIRRLSVLLLFVVTFAAVQFWGTQAQAHPSYFTTYCAGCHITTTCNGCHHHGPVGLKGVTDKSTYAPGEAVAVTISGGSQSGWFRAILYDQNNNQVAISNGNDSGMGHTATYPAVLSAPAPAAAGTYTWKVAWFGNSFDSSNMNAGSHGQVTASTNSFTVTAPADTTAPVVGTFILPATATSLIVPVTTLAASDNVAVTGYLVTTSSSKPAASASGWTAAAPTNAIAPSEGSVTFYAWAKDAAGNVSAARSATVQITLPDTSAPVVGTFTLPLTATSLTVPVTALAASDNVAVTGYLVTASSTKPAASASGWSAAAPTSVTAPAAGNVTFFAWARDAAGNVSTAKSATVQISLNTSTPPTLTVSSLADGTYTNQDTVNVSGTASDPDGLKAVTVNGQAVTVNADGSFSTALTLLPGANTITVVATDTFGTQQTDRRTITYDPTAPVITVANPADNSTTSQAFVAVSGAVSEPSTVFVKINSDAAQAAAMSGNDFSATANLVPGINTIAIDATDLAGNVSSTKRTITYQVAQVSVAVTSPAQDFTTSNSTLNLKGTVSDGVGSPIVTIAMDGVTYSPTVKNGRFQQRLTFTTAQQYAIIVTATDEAGNTSTVTRNVIYSPTAKGHGGGGKGHGSK